MESKGAITCHCNRPHRLKIWETFTDTTLGELMQ